MQIETKHSRGRNRFFDSILDKLDSGATVVEFQPDDSPLMRKAAELLKDESGVSCLEVWEKNPNLLYVINTDSYNFLVMDNLG